MKEIRKEINIKVGGKIFTIILLSSIDERGYTVRVKGLPEIITEGGSIEEAKKMAREAIELNLESEENVKIIRHEYRPHIKS